MADSIDVCRCFKRLKNMTEAKAPAPIQDVVRIESSVTSCDGRGPNDDLGHPLVYLNMGDEGHVTCPYCSRQFVLVEQCTFKG
jgi:uncharacterized Zn-finger protein